jgi:hypothetical protein
MVALAVLVACSPKNAWQTMKLQSQGQAGEVLLTVTSVTPWSQIADALQPNFTLTGDDAVLKVLPVAQRLTQQVLNSFGGSLAASLPSTSTASTVQTATPAGGSPTVTSTTTNTTAPGSSVAQSPAQPSGITVPSLLNNGNDPAVDPLQQYQAARSLFEAVSMMNREVVNAAFRECYVPYLVRLRLTVQTDRPNLGYNLHSRLAFFRQGDLPQPKDQFVSPGCRAGAAGRAPIVVPLVASDDIERAIAQQAVSVARQINLAVSGMPHGIGLGAAASNLEQSLNGVLGQSYNSRLSVAREVDNVLSVRIGATLQGQGGRALEDQPYEVATLLLVPRGYFPASASDAPAMDVGVFSDTQFIDADTGKVLPPAPQADILAQVDDAVIGGLKDTPSHDSLLAAWLKIDPNDRRRLGMMLARPVQQGLTGDFADALKCIDREMEKTPGWSGDKLFANLSCPTDPPVDPKKEGSTPSAYKGTAVGLLSACNGVECGYYLEGRLLWIRLSGIVGAYAQKSSIFQLKPPLRLNVPSQTGVLEDDGTAATLELYGVGGDTITGLLATLEWTPSDGTPVAVSGQMGIDRVNRVLTVTFPTLSRLTSPRDGKTPATLTIGSVAQTCPPELLCTDVTVGSVQVLIGKPSPAAENAIGNDTAPSIVATPAGAPINQDIGANTATFIVTASVANNATLTLTGATLTAASEPSGRVAFASGTATIPAGFKGDVLLKVSGSAVGTPVIVTLDDKTNPKGKLSLSVISGS